MKVKGEHMRGMRIWAAIIAVGVTACTPEDQMPFDLDPTAEVAKEVGSSGGTISTPAGLSLSIPAGALGTKTDLAVKPVSGAGLGTGLNATLVPGTAFEFTPKGLTLSKPARLELQAGAPTSGVQTTFVPFPDSDGPGGPLLNRLSLAEAPATVADLGFLVVIDLGNGKVQVDPLINLDIGRRVLTAWINSLGIVGVARTSPLVLLGNSQFASAGGTIRSGTYGLDCGLQQTACVSTGGKTPIAIYTDPKVISRYPKVGVIVSSARASLTFNSLLQTISGTAEVDAVIQAVVGGTVTSKDISLTLSTGQAGTIQKPSSVRYQTSGSRITFDSSTGRETMGYTATADSFELVLPETTITLADADGAEHDYPITLVVRLQKTSGN